MRETGFKPLVGKSPWRKEWQSIAAFLPGESPWTEEPGRLQSMGSQRVGHDWATQHSTHSIGPVAGREEEASWCPILTKPAPGMETGSKHYRDNHVWLSSCGRISAGADPGQEGLREARPVEPAVTATQVWWA